MVPLLLLDVPVLAVGGGRDQERQEEEHGPGADEKRESPGAHASPNV